jgi:CubicO group peptidase (beta-lactamase class C family)
MAIVEEGQAEGSYPGAAALVIRRGKVAGWLAVGSAELEPNRRPVERDTLFDLASLTKVVAGLSAALLLLDRGAVCLDDAVGRFLPAFATGEKSAITVRHLLSHASGLPPWLPCYCEARTLEETVAVIAAAELDARPGLQVRYSDAGVILLRAIVREVTGEDLPELLTREVFKPLGMHDTLYVPPAETRVRAAATERGNAHEQAMVSRAGRTFDGWREAVLVGEVHDGNAHYALEGVSSHAGLFSTIEDLGRFCGLWLGHGALSGHRVFSEAAVAEALRLQTAGLQMGYGLGWRLAARGAFSSEAPHESALTRAVFPAEAETAPAPHWMGELRSDRAYGHTGFTGTSLLIDPDRDLAMILLTNRVHPDASRTGVDRIRARWHNAVIGALVA